MRKNECVRVMFSKANGTLRIKVSDEIKHDLQKLSNKRKLSELVTRAVMREIRRECPTMPCLEIMRQKL